eukprot:CAMPEP_0184497952 /NCGR_PEP_ID=MMETSP0113_2-20130426/37795_1 /TAXON_ID=91329 /ORGANISM="Norrisiella sphaerica, Strain BC52" /LENGTH=232 /DNA_ID=CAMNT_0026885273 /DNA_START=244 /DNA_END=940 /DNA_ORIENTATION=+
MGERVRAKTRPNPHGWGVYYDKSAQRHYYFNANTGKSCWDKPESYESASENRGGDRDLSPPKYLNFEKADEYRRKKMKLMTNPQHAKDFFKQAVRDMRKNDKRVKRMIEKRGEERKERERELGVVDSWKMGKARGDELGPVPNAAEPAFGKTVADEPEVTPDIETIARESEVLAVHASENATAEMLHVTTAPGALPVDPGLGRERGGGRGRGDGTARAVVMRVRVAAAVAAS